MRIMRVDEVRGACREDERRQDSRIETSSPRHGNDINTAFRRAPRQLALFSSNQPLIDSALGEAPGEKPRLALAATPFAA